MRPPAASRVGRSGIHGRRRRHAAWRPGCIVRPVRPRPAGRSPAVSDRSHGPCSNGPAFRTSFSSRSISSRPISRPRSVGDPVKGQQLWAAILAAMAAFATAVAAPFLGAIADVGGRRKPWIFVYTLIMVVADDLDVVRRAALLDGAASSSSAFCVTVTNFSYEFSSRVPQRHAADDRAAQSRRTALRASACRSAILPAS